MSDYCGGCGNKLNGSIRTCPKCKGEKQVESDSLISYGCPPPCGGTFGTIYNAWQIPEYCPDCGKKVGRKKAKVNCSLCSGTGKLETYTCPRCGLKDSYPYPYSS